MAGMVKSLTYFFFFILLSAGTVALAQTPYYVDPDVANNGTGTIYNPFKYLSSGITAVGSGGTLYLRGGTYSFDSSALGVNDNAVWRYNFWLDKVGTAENPINIWAYQSEKPVFDFTGDTNACAFYIAPGARYYHLKGIEFKNFTIGHQSRPLDIAGDQVIVENCSSHGHAYDGLIVTGDTVLVLNCDFYDNYDAWYFGQSANGLVISGTGNIVKGSRAWFNSDDGFDLFYGATRIIMDSCYAWLNGRDVDGNGIGFKLGCGTGCLGGDGRHLLKNCIAFDNRGNGFDANDNLSGFTLYNCIGFRNTFHQEGFEDRVNFSFNYPGHDPDTVYNCINYPDGTNMSFGNSSVLITNSWQNGIVLSDADFVSIDTTGISAWTRNADGSLPTIPNSFLHLAAESDLIEAGTDVGLPYSGSSPDIGAFEYIPAISSINKKLLRRY